VKRIYYPYDFIKSIVGEKRINKEITYHLRKGLNIEGSAYNRETAEVHINLRYLYMILPQDKKDLFFKYLVYAINHEFMHYLLHKEQGCATTISFDNLYRFGITIDEFTNKIYGGV